MYIYFIRDDAGGLYLIGRTQLGAPVPTCVWGDRRNDATIFDDIACARRALRETGVVTASVYRLNLNGGHVIRLKSGADGGRLE